jgi:nitrate/TMAO reductase-like tetraheme cytochrome c subunit
MRIDPFLAIALVTSLGAFVILLWFLFKRPPITNAVKMALLMGIGVLPLLTATTGNIAGFQATKTRTFCTGSCHVMTPYGEDSEDPTSMGLAARHGRNAAFGEDNCYTCHADYGMFGTITTKIGGMRHVYEYVFNFHQLSLEEALPKIHIIKPFPNSTCMHCHSTHGTMWNRIGDHASTLDQVRAGTISCASVGCHGAAHPFSHAIHEREREREGGAR